MSYDDETHYCWQECCDLGPHPCICGNDCEPDYERRHEQNCPVCVTGTQKKPANKQRRKEKRYPTVGKGAAVSEFMERARTEATGRWPLEVPPDEEIYTYPRRAIREHKNAAFVSGALWAVYQEPTDEEVEAVAEVIYLRMPRSGDEDYADLSEAWKKVYRDRALDAFSLVQTVRAGQ